MMLSRNLKNLLGDVPLIAEVDSAVRAHQFKNDKWLRKIQVSLPEWVKTGEMLQQKHRTSNPKNIFVFACTHSWLPNVMLLCTAQRILGHKISLGYLPYRKWYEAYTKLDIRRLDTYIFRLLKKAEPFIKIVRFMNLKPTKATLPPELEKQVIRVTEWDYQYTKLVETVDHEADLYKMRLKRNMFVAQRALNWMVENKPDLVVIPNGMILEYGVVLRVARFLGIETVTYEFGEQRDRIWLSHEDSVMLQDTGEMWESVSRTEFPEENYARLDELYESRTDGKLYKSFYRQWQGTPTEGQLAVRKKLNLDERPVVLLATNVLGDSLTLGRQVFSESMTEWLQKTTTYFAQHQDVQFILRIHPGEKLIKGPSVADIIEDVFPELPENIRLVKADDPINTYDLISITSLGLTYTTTVGMEMAMRGLPVVVSGRTHYRGRGFTLDPASWEEYYKILDSFCAAPESFVYTEENVRLAKRYAYHFFFDYPFGYPWHILHVSDEQPELPLETVFSEEGLSKYGRALKFLTGELIGWGD